MYKHFIPIFNEHFMRKGKKGRIGAIVNPPIVK